MVLVPPTPLIITSWTTELPKICVHRGRDLALTNITDNWSWFEIVEKSFDFGPRGCVSMFWILKGGHMVINIVNVCFFESYVSRYSVLFASGHSTTSSFRPSPLGSGIQLIFTFWKAKKKIWKRIPYFLKLDNHIGVNLHMNLSDLYPADVWKKLFQLWGDIRNRSPILFLFEEKSSIVPYVVNLSYC